MKINSLDLIAFGNFSNVHIDLSAPGLHVIYGPNEAGKTTARKALTSLLYGIDTRTSFDFFHPMNKLQIGGVLEDQDGNVSDVIRYKKSKNDLVERTSDTPVDKDNWQRYLLNGVGKEEFESIFTLGWEQLLEETTRLVERDGAFNETIFAAGIGVKYCLRLSNTLSCLLSSSSSCICFLRRFIRSS